MLRLSLVLIAALFLGSCVPQKQPIQPVPPRNVLLVLLDAAAAKHLHDWGYPRDTAPNLRKLAREGVAFLGAHSQAANTTPSLWSCFTGKYPYIPGPGYTTHHPYPQDFTMADAFRAAGFHTFGVSENPWILGEYGWKKGFDAFEYVPALYNHHGDTWSRDPAASQRTIKRAEDWIDAQQDPWFCFVHIIRPHEPYDPPAPYASRYGAPPRPENHPRSEGKIRTAARVDPASITEDDIAYMKNLYDGNLRYGDALVGEFMAWVKAKGVRDNTLIVIIGDHGEAFMEHGLFGHNTTVYEEITSVPLIIAAPKSAGFTPGTRRGAVRLLDLLPTFAELFHLSVPTTMQGVSLMPALRGAAPATSGVSIAHSAHDHCRLAITQGPLKLIAHTTPSWDGIEGYELYDLSTDPAEKNNLAGHAQLLAPLKATAEKYLASAERRDASKDPVMEPDETERLKAIGYGPR